MADRRREMDPGLLSIACAENGNLTFIDFEFHKPPLSRIQPSRAAKQKIFQIPITL
jgi:hypothetical protein